MIDWPSVAAVGAVTLGGDEVHGVVEPSIRSSAVGLNAAVKNGYSPVTWANVPLTPLAEVTGLKSWPAVGPKPLTSATPKLPASAAEPVTAS